MTRAAVIDPPRPPDVRPARPHRHRARRAAIALVAIALLAAAAGWAHLGHGPARHQAPNAAAVATDAFFDRYVDPDGRVVRHDQGGDTVSEGQAYALLLAVAAGDHDRFDRAWHWSLDHLARPDGLWSWRWADGNVADPMPASDADLDAAWALTLAAKRFGDAGYADAARRMASSIMATEVTTAGGSPELAAGPWAVDDGTVNPGYAAPQAMDALEALTADARWSTLAADSRFLAVQLGARGLPPDWAHLGETGPAPAGPPQQPFDEPRYGLEAARVLAWSATDCSSASRGAIDAWAAVVSDHPSSADRALDGTARSGSEHAATGVASALTLARAGRADDSTRALVAAAATDQAHPSYYGAAWIALGRQLLDPHSVFACSPA